MPLQLAPLTPFAGISVANPIISANSGAMLVFTLKQRITLLQGCNLSITGNRWNKARLRYLTVEFVNPQVKIFNFLRPPLTAGGQARRQ